jgi:peptide/nickel transport system permease protein
MTITGPAKESGLQVLSVRQLVWLRFRRNRPAVWSMAFLLFMYLLAGLAPFVAPYGVRTTHSQYSACHPNGPRFLDAQGQFHLQPFVYGLDSKVDPKTFAKVYPTNTDKMYPVRFFASGEPYKLLGVLPTDKHLFQVDEPGKIFLLGTDKQGRDLFSRILFGSQVSLTVGLLGVALSVMIGSFFGVLTGYFGGTVDNIVQRIIEALMAFPQIPLWLALSSALPANLSPIRVYFGVTIVLSIVNWGGLARQVRAKVLALRDLDYVVSARLVNCRDLRIILRHLLPNTISQVLVVATLAIPGMILGETALSFLGLGIRPPMTSWGLLLSEAQEVRVLLQQPWLLSPVAFVVAVCIAYNFLGDGMRDAADPFAD